MRFQLFFFIIFFSTISLSDVRRNADLIFIEGEIHSGDSETFRSLVQKAHLDGEKRIIVHLNSPGGSFLDALEIGKFVRNNYLPTFVNNPFIEDEAICASSCFFILSAGVKRLPLDKKHKATGEYYPSIYLHRPFYRPDVYSSMAIDDAMSKFSDLQNMATVFLNSMGVPHGLIEKLLNTSSDEAYPLSSEDFNSVIGRHPPFIEEMLLAQCGKMPHHELSDLLKSYRESANLSEGYIEYLRKKDSKITKCEHDYFDRIQFEALKKTFDKR